MFAAKRFCLSTSSLFFALLISSHEAQAFRCTAVPGANLTQVWQSRCIPYWISCNGDLFLGEEMRQLVQKSFAKWSGTGCTDLEFYDAGYTPQLEDFVPQEPDEQRNVVAAIEDEDSTVFPDPRLLALTFTHFSVMTGEVFDSDILFNAARFEFIEVDSSCPANGNTFDLENTLVHEIGHFIGFDHNLVDPETTMFSNAQACETKKRDLAEDDVMAVCNTYPTGGRAATCLPAADYNPSQADPTPFRQQCARAQGETALSQEQCECELGGGCSCRTARGASHGSGSQSRLGLVWLLLLALVRRRALEPQRSVSGR